MSLRRRLRRARTVLGDVRRAVSTAAEAPQAFAPGAFYSPVPDARELTGPERDRLWPEAPRTVSGFDLAERRQLQLLGRLDPWPQAEMERASAGYRVDNDQFPPQDASLLYSMVSSLQPRRIVEIGCGWSTTVIAQAIRDSAAATELVCIEPYPRDFLRSIPEVSRLREERVEHVELAQFTGLEAGDVLFIDTSHVVKTGSDVVHLVLEVLPHVADGVVVHVHDIFLPYEYPEGWVRAGFGWNEQYLLHAYFIGNERVKILAMNHWLTERHRDELRHHGYPGDAGSSLWFALGSLPTQLGPDERLERS